MNEVVDIRTSVIQGLKDVMKSSYGIKLSDFDDYIYSEDIFSNSVFSKSIKDYIEKALLNQLECKLGEVPDIQKMTWKIDAHNIAKDVLDSPKVTSIKQNLDNIIESCVVQICSEIKTASVLERRKEVQMYLPLAENSIQPIESKFSELAELISSTKPAQIRIKAYELLIASHYADTLTNTNWIGLQHTFQEGLNDNNMDIFKLCLKLHGKLLSCSSFEIVKDTFLNLLESSCRQYNEQESEYEKISFCNNKQFRMISVVNLIVNATKIITQNAARFGIKRLEEIIDNLVHLLSMHYSSKSVRRKSYLSPFEIISCLDPMGSWCVYLTHGVVTRNILLNPTSNSSKNNSLLQLIVEELNDWFLNPSIPDDLNIDLNEISITHIKYAVFVHSLSLFSTICQYEMGRAFFPLLINKNEESVSISAVTEKVLVFLHEKIEDDKGLNRKCSRDFIDFVEACAQKLFSIKESRTTLLHKVMNPLQQTPLKLSSHVLNLLDTIQQCECDKHFYIKHLTVGRKRGAHINKVTASASCLRSKRYKSPSDLQNLLLASSENNPLTCILNVLVNTITIILENKEFQYPIHLVCKLIDIFEKYLIHDDGMYFVINKQNGSHLIHTMALKFKENISNEVDNLRNTSRIQDINLIRSSQILLLRIGATPVGSYLLKEEGVLDSILRVGLEAPEISWINIEWRLFISYCCQYIADTDVHFSKQNTLLVKQELIKLWEAIDTDCSGSDIQIQEAIQNFLTIVTSFGFSLKGVSAMFVEPEDGSDVTLTDQTDLRPTTIATLIQNFAISLDNIYEMIFHNVALSVLHIFVSNLDTNLHLLHILEFQKHILQLQSDNRLNESSEVIIDESSMIRHTILEQSYFPRNIRTDIKLYYIPPQGTSTLHRVKAKSRFNGELTKFLQETRTCLHDLNWLKQAKKSYKASVNDDIKGLTILETLEQVKKCLPDVNNGIKWVTAEETEKVHLFPEEELGIQFVIRYGAHHRLVQPTQQNTDNLKYLICLTQASLGTKFDKFSRFDWFLGSAFLICSGNVERCQNFLSCFSTLPTANYIWPSLASNKSEGFAFLGQLMDSILANELPCAFYTLQSNGISWWLICQQWIRECFWNTLDWNQVCHWLMLSILQPTEYIIYFCVALLQVNEQFILKLSREGNLYQIFVNPVSKFQMVDIFSFMDRLCKRYHNVINMKNTVLL